MFSLTLAGIPIAVGANEAVHRQRLLDEEAEAEERQEEFYLDVFCDAQSKKKDEVNDTIIVLREGGVSNAHQPSQAHPVPRLIHHVFRFNYGPKTKARDYHESTLILEKYHTPSQASIYPSHQTNFRTAQYLQHQSSGSSVPFHRLRKRNQKLRPLRLRPHPKPRSLQNRN